MFQEQPVSRPLLSQFFKMTLTEHKKCAPSNNSLPASNANHISVGEGTVAK